MCLLQPKATANGNIAIGFHGLTIYWSEQSFAEATVATQEQLMGALQVVVNLTRCVALKRALTVIKRGPLVESYAS